jgi:hypothetical protein
MPPPRGYKRYVNLDQHDANGLRHAAVDNQRSEITKGQRGQELWDSKEVPVIRLAPVTMMDSRAHSSARHKNDNNRTETYFNYSGTKEVLREKPNNMMERATG